MSCLSRLLHTRTAYPRRRVIRTLCSGALLLLGVQGDLAAQSAPTAAGPSLVILVRHGEKALEPAADPNLSPAGQERAKALLDALQHVQPSAIIVSATRRTGETAALLAAKSGVTPQVVSLTGGGATHVNAVADAVRRQHGVVVVVGHSNTVPAIVKALGGPALPDLCDSSYAYLFLLQPGKDGKPATLVRAQYGAVDPAVATGCPAMHPPR